MRTTTFWPRWKHRKIGPMAGLYLLGGYDS